MAPRIAVFLALVVAVAAACGEDKKPAVEVSVHDLRPGDCFDGTARQPEDPGDEERPALVVGSVPCSQSHDKEVFAVFEHPAKPDSLYPGEKEVAKVAQDGCADRVAAYVGRSFEESDLLVAVIAPGPAFWDGDDDRTIVCTLQGNKPLKGSQKADAG
ncbi:MAG: septum formation family protein [Acidimicrobiia bacterium]